ncbi:MAG: hypothetical protein KC912_20415 [Proteobacteria bacterium]|nr:hypothetical protein [Pseudomonadota bacterium]
MRRCAEAFGTFEMYIRGPVTEGFGTGLVRRHDAAMNYLKTLPNVADGKDMLARLNLFRGTYALHDELRHALSAPMLNSPKFSAAAAELTGKPLVVPSMLYANLLLPGQELAMHTDTPEYRGIDKWNMPEWFLVVMMHSGLFEDWRKHVTAGVAFYGDCEGGDFVFYPDGPEGRRMHVPVKANTAIHLDVDGMFHGVERVGGPESAPPPLEAGMTLSYAGDDTWNLCKGDEVVRSYAWGELRYSVQWKANCFVDAAEKSLIESHDDDLNTQTVIDTLAEDLRQRGRITGDRPADIDLALMMMDEYIVFPGPVEAA